MNVLSFDLNGTQGAEMQSQGIVIRSARDAADVIDQLLERGVKKLILHERNLCPEMWQVSNGLAAAILKKFIDSAVGVAIVGKFDQLKIKGLKELIEESNSGSQVCFVDDVESAKKRLSQQQGRTLT
jgi:hypothetical protein